MQNISNIIMKSLEILVVIILAVMSILVIVNVGLRFAFSSGIVVSEELSRFLFIWVVFLGAIIAMKSDSHIYVDFIRKALPKPIQSFVKVFCYGAMLYCCYLLCVGSYELYEFNMEDLSPVAQIPLGYIYISGSIGAIGMGIILVFNILQLVMNIVKGKWE
jgi:TRAP-type C4-dicarboxylate transport system permease small subunit